MLMSPYFEAGRTAVFEKLALHIRDLVKMRKHITPSFGRMGGGETIYESTLPKEIIEHITRSHAAAKAAPRVSHTVGNMAKRQALRKELLSAGKSEKDVQKALRDLMMKQRTAAGKPLTSGLRETEYKARSALSSLYDDFITRKAGGPKAPDSAFRLSNRAEDVIAGTKMHRSGQSSTTELREALQGLGLGKKHYGEVIRRQPGAVMETDSVYVSPYAQRAIEAMGKLRDRGRGLLVEKNPLAFEVDNPRLGRRGLSTLGTQRIVSSVTQPIRTIKDLAKITRKGIESKSSIQQMVDEFAPGMGSMFSARRAIRSKGLTPDQARELVQQRLRKAVSKGVYSVKLPPEAHIPN